MHFSEHALPYDERPLEQWHRVVVPLLEDERPAQHGKAGGGLVVTRPIKRLGDVQRLAVIPLGFLVMPPLVLHGAEVDEILGDERVTFPVEFARQREDEPIQRIGDREVPRVEVRVCQLAHARGQLCSGLGWRHPSEPNACSSTLIPSSYLPLSSKTCPSATVALAIAGSPGRRCRLLIASPSRISRSASL